jgi:hypothetical protein
MEASGSERTKVVSRNCARIVPERNENSRAVPLEKWKVFQEKTRGLYESQNETMLEVMSREY